MRAILVLTNTRDTATDWVIRELRSRGHTYIRVNADVLDECPVSVTADNFLYRAPDGRTWDLRAIVGAVYLRRPDPPQLPSPTQPPDQQAIARYLEGQWRALLRGLQVLDAKWVNPMAEGILAEAKIAQISRALELGFDVPSTLVTNDPDRARQFARRWRRVVAKALDTPLLETPEGSDFVFTQLLDPALLSDPKVEREIRASPTIFQEPIVHKVDVRVTVVGNSAFGVEVRHSGADLDWRRAPREEIGLVPLDLPPALAERCITLVRSFGLRYGALDFACRDDRYYFLELNPSGEWGWLQSTGVPIAEAIVDLLETLL